MAVLESAINSPVERTSLVGVPRLTMGNNDIIMFLVGFAQIRKPYKTPAKPFRTWLCGRLHAWWSNGGHSGQFRLKKEVLRVKESG